MTCCEGHKGRMKHILFLLILIAVIAAVVGWKRSQ